MQFKRIALASAITSILAGCGADDQPYEYLSKPSNTYTRDQIKTDQVLMNPLMILVKIIKLRWIHI
uniref:hypothetical protein n=1 Tax=Vibrio cholerae TaxID=666 RepID=UPI0006B9BA27